MTARCIEEGGLSKNERSHDQSLGSKANLEYGGSAREGENLSLW